MKSDIITVGKADTTLSVLLARHYRRVILGAVEIVHDLNQDLSLDGAYLRVGRSVIVPALQDMLKAQPSAPEIVDLFT